MNTELSYTIIYLSCMFTAIATAWNMGRTKNESKIWLLESRVKTLEKELSYLTSIVKLNTPTFLDHINNTMKEFKGKLKDE
jgi:hypothetical protein